MTMILTLSRNISKSSIHFGRHFRLISSSSSTTTVTSNAEPQILIENVCHDNEYPDRIITKMTMNRPKANAMGRAMIEELNNFLKMLEDDETKKKSRCVVITSFSDRVFSAGADLKERKGMSITESENFVTLLRSTMERVAQLPIPVIAAVEGVAVGGGLELALAADMRVASSSATFGLPETTLAIIPGAGGTQRLPRIIGPSRAKELIWTGKRIDGDEAFKIGLVDKLVPPGHATNDAIRLGHLIAGNGPIAIQASKEAINRGIEEMKMDDALEVERQCYSRVLTTKDRLEGLAAFSEGRKPEYKGQ